MKDCLNIMKLEELILLFKENCKATYKMPNDKIAPIFYVIDNLDDLMMSCTDKQLKLKCKQAYNILLDHDELKASFLEIIKIKKKMSEYVAVVSDANPANILEKKV